MENVESKLNKLRSRFPIGQIVKNKGGTCRYKVLDYNYSESDDALTIRLERLGDFPCFYSFDFDNFIGRFETVDKNAKWADNEFFVTNTHIQLLNSCYVSWNSCEFGAPTIDPKRPLGNSDVETDFQEITGLSYDEKTYKELETCLQILIDELSIHTGLYRYDKEDGRWYAV